jgi:hypothetical protein
MKRRILLASVIAAPAPALAQQRLPPPVPVQQGQAGPPGAEAVPLDDRVAPGIRRDVMVRWGDRIGYDAPAWAPNRPDADAAQRQFGWDARIVGLTPAPAAADGVPRAILAVAHPSLDPGLAFPAGSGSDEVALAMQGASILNLEYQGTPRAGRWVVVDGGFQSRRITGSTLCRVSGPLVGDAALASALGAPDAVRGVLQPQGGCVTPWGTLLLAEGEADSTPAWAAPRLPDQGARARFGLVVELDPMDPSAVPVKRTAVGRRAHGDVAAALARDNRAVLYLTEKRPGGFLYRFVSEAPVTVGGDNMALLDRGAIFVARRAGDRAVWVRLPDTNAARLDPRAAARALNATPLDLPSGLAIGADGHVFVALSGEGAPGTVLHLVPGGGDHGGEAFDVATLLAIPAGQRPSGSDAPMANPDALAAGGAGRLLVGTDTMLPNVGNGLFAVATEGVERGRVRRLYGTPRGASLGGAAMAGDGTIFAAVRRPGSGPGASFANPATRWPAFDPALPPRSMIVALTAT